MKTFEIAAVPLLLLVLVTLPIASPAADRSVDTTSADAPSAREIVPRDGFRAMFANDRMAGLDTFAIYLLQNNELMQTKFLFPQKHVKSEMFFEDFARVEADLRQKLGEPKEAREIWRSGTRNETADPARMIAIGELTLQSEWETEDMIIVHSLRGESLDIDHEVNYISKRLSRAAAEVMQEIRPKHFF